MENDDRGHDESINSFFDHELQWWTEVYREDLPKGFFSFEMRERLKQVTEILGSQIRKLENPNVLECGCGPGDILASLAPLHCRLTGLDLNPRYLALAAEKAPSATLVEGSVERLPFPDDSFDVVFAVGVFLYLKDDQKAAQEIARVTKDGGFVLISNPNYLMLHLLFDPYYVFRLFKRVLGFGGPPSSTRFDDTKMRRYTIPQFKALFRTHNLHEIQSTVTSFGPGKFWRREILPLSASIRISNFMRNVSGRKLGSFLKPVGNHIIITLRKGLAGEGEGTH